MPWWVWLLVVLAVVAAAAALWYFYLRPEDNTPSTAGDDFIGNWSPEAGTGGGLVIKQSGDQFKVTQYDPQLQQAGSTNATLVGEELQVSVKASALGLTDVTGSVTGTLTHDSANDTLTLQFSAGSLQMKPILLRARGRAPAGDEPDAVSDASRRRRPLSPSPTTTASPSSPVRVPHGRPAGGGRHRQAAGGHRGLGGGQQQPVPAAAGRRRRRRHLAVRRPLADQPLHRASP